MKVLERFDVPTGHILVVEGAKGKLELVSMGDYGKDVNLNKSAPVRDGCALMPLTEKWVITISTQYGCSMGCRFCDVPRVGKGTNCTLNDLQQQILTALHLHPEVKYSNRLNIHYARMGEPTWNPAVLDHAKWLKEHIDPEYNVHPVLSTMMPAKHEWLKTMIHAWIRIKNRLYCGNAGLQISLNGTDENERLTMFNGNALSIPDIAKIFDGAIPFGRKFTLNFPVAQWQIDPSVLIRYFNPEHWICKLTPMHKTVQSERFGHHTEGDPTAPASYSVIAGSLRKVGYEVLVFIASAEEDEGMITCGNAILAQTKKPKLRRGPMRFIGGSAIGRNKFISWSDQKDRYHAECFSGTTVPL